MYWHETIFHTIMMQCINKSGTNIQWPNFYFTIRGVWCFNITPTADDISMSGRYHWKASSKTTQTNRETSHDHLIYENICIYTWYTLAVLNCGFFIKKIHNHAFAKTDVRIQTNDWIKHDDIIKWKHFPRYCPFVRGVYRSPVNSPHKGQWRGALLYSLVFLWINGWVNNREAGDLRRYCAHYDGILMTCGTEDIAE